MSHVSTTELVEELEAGETDYVEVLSEDSMRAEVAMYPNPAPKTPHDEDELYFIISGTGTVTVGDESYPVEEGDVVFVEEGAEHDFSDIEDEITALVIFAGAEESVLGRPA
jgi:mannose-6-phosphate isomerase-like protein (cupin superfamily)